MNLPIVFENSSVVVVDKPAGALSIPGRFPEEDPRPCVYTQLCSKHPEILTVHRLDAEVTGLLIFAKTPEAHQKLSHWFEQRKIHKFYEALTETFPSETQDYVWKSNLLRGKKRAFEKSYGKPSETHAHFLGTTKIGSDTFGKWSLNPITGRSHQLRFELAKHGYPIWGDTLYGAKGSYNNFSEAIALKAVRLEFPSGDFLDLGLPTSLNLSSIWSS